MTEPRAKKPAAKKPAAKRPAAKRPETSSIGGGAPGLAPKVDPKIKAHIYDWAVNKLKLELAHKHITLTQPDLVAGSTEHENAVKERYLELKGQLASDHGAASRPRRKSNVVNLADDDGGGDDGDDE